MTGSRRSIPENHLNRSFRTPSAARVQAGPMRTHRLYPMIVLVALVGAACSPDEEPSMARAGRSPSQVSTASSISEDGGYAVDIDPADFVDRIDNRYFPLEPGTVFRLRGVTEDGIENEQSE